jgi:class 3 adenylate cyclase/tetratricopeptide (TPR) repeat protein
MLLEVAMPAEDYDGDATKRVRTPERKLLSVLFADVKGSTELVFGLDPEDALERLRPVVKILHDAVHQFDGVVSNTQGDGIMALFGAPSAADDHAILACLAALRIQEGLATLAGPKVRIGVHSGEVVLQHVSHDLTSIYNAAGPVVHVAQKIQADAKAGEILVSTASLALTGGIFESEPVPMLRISGVTGGVGMSRLVGLGSTSRWRARAAAGLSPFVGRSAELQILEDAASSVGKSGAVSIAIQGEAGAGKSRIAHEFLDRLRDKGWNAFELAGELAWRRTAWRAAGRLLQVVWKDRDADQIAAELAATESLEDNNIAALRSLLGLAVSTEMWRDTEPERRNRLMTDTLALGLKQKIRSMNGPTALLVDDEQWIDPESLEALNLLVERKSVAPILVVVARRTPDRSPRRPARTLTLAALKYDEAKSLLDRLVGADQNLEELKRRVIGRTGGMPLFLEEAVKHLMETGLLFRAPDGATLQLPDAEIGIPATIQGLLSARIDRLSDAARDAIQIASVFGDPVALADVGIVANETEDSIKASFSELTDSALMAAAAPRQNDYLFAHDLIREVAYSSMVRDRRRTLHRLILDHLAAAEKGAPERLLETLHRHAVGAEEWARALEYARLAASRAIERSAYRTSLTFFEAALAALDHIEPSRPALELGIDLRLDARIALGATADLNRLVAYAKEAEAKALQIGDARRALTAKMHKANALIYVGAAEESLSAAEEALAAATAARSRQIEIVASYVLAGSNYSAGRFRRTSELTVSARGGLAESEKLGRIGTTGTTLVLLDVMETAACAWLGEFQYGDARLAEAVQLAAQTGRPYDSAACAFGATVALIQRGRLEDAIAAGEPALKLIREFDLRFFFPLVINQLGFALAATGRAEEGLALLRESHNAARELEHIAARASAEAGLGHALMRLDRDTEAEEALRSSLQLSRQQGFNGVRIVAAQHLAELVGRSRHREEEGDDLLVEAIEVASACEARPSAARCKLALARLRRNRGDHDGARLLAEDAAKAFDDMGIEHDLAEARSVS